MSASITTDLGGIFAELEALIKTPIGQDVASAAKSVGATIIKSNPEITSDAATVKSLSSLVTTAATALIPKAAPEVTAIDDVVNDVYGFLSSL